MNMTYKTPMILVNMWQRIGFWLFGTSVFFLLFTMDDMTRMFMPFKLGYMGRAEEPIVPSRY